MAGASLLTFKAPSGRLMASPSPAALIDTTEKGYFFSHEKAVRDQDPDIFAFDSGDPLGRPGKS